MTATQERRGHAGVEARGSEGQNQCGSDKVSGQLGTAIPLQWFAVQDEIEMLRLDARLAKLLS